MLASRSTRSELRMEKGMRCGLLAIFDPLTWGIRAPWTGSAVALVMVIPRHSRGEVEVEYGKTRPSSGEGGKGWWVGLGRDENVVEVFPVCWGRQEGDTWLRISGAMTGRDE